MHRMETSPTTVSAEERLVRDGRTTWRVYRVLDAGRASLVFDSECIVRRVRDFPEIWLTLGDDDLLALSWKR